MPKKKAFKKENSEKFLLLRGNSQAVNADGKTLENILVPVSKNYKPGTSLLLSSIPAFSNLDPDDIIVEHEENEGIFDDASTVDDSDAAENIVENLLSDVKKLKFSEQFENTLSDDDDDDDFGERGRKYGSQDKSSNSKEDNWRNICRNSENWKMFNEKFDKILEEYDDSEIGSLDGDLDIGGMHMGSPEPLNDDSKDHKVGKYVVENLPTATEMREALSVLGLGVQHRGTDGEFREQYRLELVLGDYDEELKEKILNYANDSGDEKIVEIVVEKAVEYDCESILSTCSNLYNHPAIIKEERTQRIRKTSLVSDKGSEHDCKTDLNSKLLTNTCNMRKKGETPEERKERQKKFKEVKKLRRELKKQNKEAFKEEKKSQTIKDHQNAAIKLL